MLDRLRRRGSEEHGVVLVLVAVMMTAFLGMAALAIDLGSLYQAQRQAQSAADAAALAGADDLPGSPSAATTAAASYVAMNIAGVPAACTANQPGVCISTPYNSSASQIKVTVTKSVPTPLAAFLGISTKSVSASAVAGGISTTPAPAIFGADSNCDGALTINGTADIPSGVETPGDIKQNGNSNVFGPSKAGCPYTVNGTGNTYNGASSPTHAAPTPSGFPLDYSQSPNTPTCTFSGTSFTFQTTGATIPPGVYCATGAIDITANNLIGNGVTFKASSFQLNGQNETFTPAFKNLLIWDTGSGGLNVNVNSSANFLEGATVFAPTDSVTINGGSGTFSGFVEAYKVTLNGGSPGSPFVLNSTGPTSGSGGGQLLN